MTTGNAPSEDYDIIVAGGGPSGATAAADLAAAGWRTLLVDAGERIKPCGGAIPPLVLEEFDVPQSLVVARIGGARIISPTARSVDMAIGDGFVGMVDRETFDPWLRQRAVMRGAELDKARVTGVEFAADGRKRVAVTRSDGSVRTVSCRLVVGADGANSAVRRIVFGKSAGPRYVFAYHEIVEAPEPGAEGFDPRRCDVHYDGTVSPDFYGWVFPHGSVASVGVGSAAKGFDLRRATALLRERAGLGDRRVIRREGAPLPLSPMRRWHDKRGVLLIGDAAGCVAPASGEGIYYAMHSGRLAADAAAAYLRTGRAAELAAPRRRFMRGHGIIFLILGVMQRFWYRSDKRRERFTAICADRDVQRLTWESYLNKRVVWKSPVAHLRVAAKDLGHMLGLAMR